MNLRSDLGRRRSTRLGFTLIESLVATAIMALLVGTALSGVSWTLGQSTARHDRAWLTELARSVADEYRMTRDPELAQGRAAPDFVWELSAGDPPPSVVSDAGTVEVTVSAWREGREGQPVVLQFLLPGGEP